MIGGARVVGLGEATHSSHDFFALKDRVFRHLVEENGFRTFALEAAWSTGLRLNDYVVHGKGDPRRIMREEFQRDYLWWNNTDYLKLVEWMRAYNRLHPHDPVQFMGDDLAWTGPEVYDQVTDYVAANHPESSAHPAQLAAAMRYRDKEMAADVVWWQEHTGTKVLLSAHDNHVGYASTDPAHYPKVQGAFLRDSLGSGYVSVGLTFDRGSFNATGQDGAIHRWTLGPAGRGTNERTLDRVRYRDYVLDLRSVGSPAREWLARARPTRSIGTDYPDGPYDIALARTHDVLIHLHRVGAARLRDR